MSWVLTSKFIFYHKFLSYEINFNFSVNVRYAGKEIEGSPFIMSAAPSGDANKCKFVNNAAEKVIFGKKNRLTVDAREAGDGNVTCSIKSQNGRQVSKFLQLIKV